MRTVTWVLVGVMLMMGVPACAQIAQEQAADFQRMAVSQELSDRMEMFRQMGMDEPEALFFATLSSGKMDPAQMMLLMAMMGGHMGGDEAGMLLLMQAMSGKQGAVQPVVLDRGETLFIIEDGVLYKINLETLKVEASVAYGKDATGNADAAWRMLGPLFQQQREKARQAACLSNAKQLCLAFLMYAQDWDEALPGENWVEDIYPYCKNRAIYTCPSRPDLPVAYAMNEKLLGAKLDAVTRPSEIALIFESNVGGASPVGGPDEVPLEGVHNGGINVGFVDGHCKWLTAEAARELLEREPF